MTIYLYKKTHKETGLKYLGKTIARNPYSYPGSGIYWQRHLEAHGNNVETEILRECQSTEELKYWGQYYSDLWNVVESKEWANLKPEVGDGGGMPVASRKKFAEKMKGHPNWLKSQTESAKQLIKEAQKELLSKLTPEELSVRMKNSCCRSNSYTAERAQNISKATTGKKKTKTPKLLAAIEAKRERSIQNMLKAAKNHRGKTWKLINGKRVWLDKETQNY